MRLEVTRRTDLATRALLTLAARGERMKAAELADALDASSGFLSQAMTPLVGRGWVRSDPGPAGGYTATIGLDQISVLDVVEAVEGATDQARCVLEERECSRSARCALHDAWVQARDQLLGQLAATQLSSIPTPRT
jgi:Rrf2 family protein